MGCRRRVCVVARSLDGLQLTGYRHRSSDMQARHTRARPKTPPPPGPDAIPLPVLFLLRGVGLVKAGVVSPSSRRLDNCSESEEGNRRAVETEPWLPLTDTFPSSCRWQRWWRAASLDSCIPPIHGLGWDGRAQHQARTHAPHAAQSRPWIPGPRKPSGMRDCLSLPAARHHSLGAGHSSRGGKRSMEGGGAGAHRG